MKRSVAAASVGLAVWLAAADSTAAGACDGPGICCGPLVEQQGAPRQTVSLGVAIQGVHNLDEKAGGWDVDYYLYEKWVPTQGFTPQTEIVNETAREDSPHFELVELKNGLCQRSQRLHSTLRVDYDLRRFPFDQQSLLLILSDAEYDASRLVYSEQPTVADVDEHVRSQVSAWQVDSTVGYVRKIHRFTGEEGSPPYDYATFSVPVVRRVEFHVTKYFFPLFVIVIVGFCVFWIEPDDLNTQVSIGVTCLLAAIAFQFAESSSLPAVAYLTLADRIYVACYLAIALTLVGAVYMHSLVRRGKHHAAVVIERRFRFLFPAALLVAVGVSVALSFRS